MRLFLLKLVLAIRFTIEWFMVKLGAKEPRKAKPLTTEKRYLKPTQDKTWNPMLKYPRNESCYCGSGVKYKKCCFLTDPITVPTEIAQKAAPLVRMIKEK